MVVLCIKLNLITSKIKNGLEQLKELQVNPDGSIDEKDAGNWSAAEKVLPKPGKEKYGVLSQAQITQQIIITGSRQIHLILKVMALYENDIVDYHRKTKNIVDLFSK